MVNTQQATPNNQGRTQQSEKLGRWRRYGPDERAEAAAQDAKVHEGGNSVASVETLAAWCHHADVPTKIGMVASFQRHAGYKRLTIPNHWSGTPFWVAPVYCPVAYVAS